MNKPTATQLELATYTEADAFGPPFPFVDIADVPCSVLLGKNGHVTVVDDRGACHDFQGQNWSQIKASMLDYFGVVEDGE